MQLEALDWAVQKSLHETHVFFFSGRRDSRSMSATADADSDSAISTGAGTTGTYDNKSLWWNTVNERSFEVVICARMRLLFVGVESVAYTSENCIYPGTGRGIPNDKSMCIFFLSK